MTLRRLTVIGCALAVLAACGSSTKNSTSADTSKSAVPATGPDGSTLVPATGPDGSTLVPTPGSSAGSAGSGGSTTDSTVVGTTAQTVPATTTPATTVAIIDTTAPPTTPPPTTEAPTTTADPNATLGLSAVGLGPYAFGTPASSMFGDLNGRFGDPGSDDTTTFSMVSGVYTSDDGQFTFSTPVGRQVCWPNGLCITLGGPTSEALTFLGWQYQGDEFDSLHAASGLTLGSRWSDFPTAMTASPGGCYTIGAGKTSDGIDLVLEGSDFTLVGDDGTVTALLPAPVDVTVFGMSAGEAIADTFSDC